MTTSPLLHAIRSSLGALGRLAPDGTARLATRLAFRPMRLPARPWEVAALSEARAIRLPGPRGASTGFEWRPDGEARGSVLMMHGWEGRASQFARLGPLLAAAGLRAVSVDAPGHGDSPRGDGGPDEWVETVRMAAAELGPLSGLVGHSLGSVASLIALERGVRAERLALFAPPAHVRPRMESAADRIGLTGAARERFIELTVDRILADGGRTDLTAVAAAHAPRALVLHAPDDDDVPIDEGRRLAASMGDAEFVTTDAIGHFRILREASVLQRVQRFLADGTGPEPTPRPVLESVR